MLSAMLGKVMRMLFLRYARDYRCVMEVSVSRHLTGF